METRRSGGVPRVMGSGHETMGYKEEPREQWNEARK